MNPVQQALGFVRPAVRRMSGYVPGLQPRPGQRLVKLNTNENPYPPSTRVLQALREATEAAVRLYPPPEADPLRERAAALYGVTPSQVMCGNGSDEILALLMRAFVDEGERVAFFEPSYSLYPVLAEISRARTVTVPLPRMGRMEEMADLPVPSPRAKLFLLTTPNAPYGAVFPTAWIGRLLESFTGIVVADEAYVDFAGESSLPLLAAHPRLLITRTLSKAYSLAGMRVGLLFGHEELIRQMAKVRDSYNVGRYAQIAACAALEDQEYFRRTRNMVVATRGRFSAGLAARGFSVLPSGANFVFAVPPSGVGAKKVCEGLLERGFLVRYFSHPVIADGLRISIGTDEQMDALLNALEETCHGDE
jgi:histidinol-phosphate aminotransferase